MRGMRWLAACLDALRAQTMPNVDVVFVVNGGEDGSADWLEKQRDIRVILNDGNFGYAKAVNQGIASSAAPFVAVLNDDTEVSPGWLQALHAEMSDPQVGAVASLMVYASAPDVVQSAGVSLDGAAIAWDRLGGRPVSEAMRASEVFGASGGACLYRRAMLDQIGLYDERFFIYLEDVDLAWRAQRAGWRCRYAPAALVRHYLSATSGAGSPFKQHLLGRNKIWLAAKHARRSELPLIFAFDLMAVIYGVVRRRNVHHVRGRLDGLKRWREFRRDRGAWQRRAPLAPVTLPWIIAGRMP